MRFVLVMCRFLELMCQEENQFMMCKRERKKDTYQICDYRCDMFAFSRQRFGSGQPLEIRSKFVRNIFVKGVGWLRSVTIKCLIGTASGTNETSRQEVRNDGTGYAVALVDDRCDDRPPPPNDRTNSPSWLHWRRCGKWAFDADMEDTCAGGSLRQRQSREKKWQKEKCRLHAY